MNRTAAIDTARKWPIKERMEFLFQIWDEVVSEAPAPEPDDDLVRELDRRLDLHQANPDDVRTWDEVVQRARASKAGKRTRK